MAAWRVLIVLEPDETIYSLNRPQERGVLFADPQIPTIDEVLPAVEWMLSKRPSGGVSARVGMHPLEQGPRRHQRRRPGYWRARHG